MTKSASLFAVAHRLTVKENLVMAARAGLDGRCVLMLKRAVVFDDAADRFTGEVVWKYLGV